MLKKKIWAVVPERVSIHPTGCKGTWKTWELPEGETKMTYPPPQVPGQSWLQVLRKNRHLHTHTAEASNGCRGGVC